MRLPAARHPRPVRRALRALRAVALLGAVLLAAPRLEAQFSPAAAAGAARPDSLRVTLALVGGRVIDGYGGRPIENGVVLVAGERIVAVGPRATTPVPAGVDTISTEGMTVLPGLFDMHVHLMLLGHGDYRRWNTLHGARTATDVMPVAARQLLMAGVTSARDLGATPSDILAVRRRIDGGEIPGPRLFVAGAFIQRAPYEEYERPFRWGVRGPEDARRRVRELVEAGVDVIKLIDQDQLTDAEVAAIVDEAHRARKPVIAHAHRMQEIRVGLKHNVDGFEHTGLGTAPGYPEDVLQQLRERNTALYWTPTLMPLSLLHYTGEVFPERLDDPRWREGMPPAMADEIRRSLDHIPALPYYALFPSRIPLLPQKFRQLRETGVRLLIGTDAGIPATFHGDATWREMALWQDYGVRPMEILQAATLWPARALRVDDRLGTLAPGKLADVIAVRGDPLTDLRALRDVVVVVKGGRRHR
jgi:imidazolonepropionase-like amidohydrolase